MKRKYITILIVITTILLQGCTESQIIKVEEKVSELTTQVFHDLISLDKTRWENIEEQAVEDILSTKAVELIDDKEGYKEIIKSWGIKVNGVDLDNSNKVYTVGVKVMVNDFIESIKELELQIQNKDRALELASLYIVDEERFKNEMNRIALMLSTKPKGMKFIFVEKDKELYLDSINNLGYNFEEEYKTYLEKAEKIVGEYIDSLEDNPEYLEELSKLINIEVENNK